MSNPGPQDEQAGAEAVDEEVVGDQDFPPDRRQGVDVASPEEVPDVVPPADEPITGLLDDEDDPDEEVAVLGDPEPVPPAEEAAVHLTEEPGSGPEP